MSLCSVAVSRGCGCVVSRVAATPNSTGVPFRAGLSELNRLFVSVRPACAQPRGHAQYALRIYASRMDASLLLTLPSAPGCLTKAARANPGAPSLA